MTDHKAASGLMMSEQGRADMPLVTAYGKDGFVIGGRRIAGALILLADRVHPLDVSDMAEMTSAMLDPLFSRISEIDVLLVGTGEKMIPLSRDLRAMFDAHALSPDLMDSGACIRTFNILLLEDRRVAALLLPV